LPKTAQQSQQNWVGASSRAATAWTSGIQSTQKDQAGLAAAAQPLWLAGVQDAAANKRFANGVTRRGTAYWKSQSEAKSGNYVTGYAAGANNFGAAITKIVAAEANIVSALPPRGDINANLQRAQQLALALHQLKGTLGAF
jgi:hypothetical protein